MASRKTTCQTNEPPAVQPMFGAMVTRAMITGCDLGIFERLARGPASARQLARALQVKERGLTMLLDALVGTQQLVKEELGYALPPRMQAMLALPGVEPETYFGDLQRHGEALMARWSQLAEVVRTGQPIRGGGDQVAMEKAYQGLARYLFANNYLQAQALFDKMKARFGKGPVEILDVAAGATPWSMPFVHGNPQAQATAFDFPAVLEVARHFGEAFGVADRYAYQPGHLRKDGFAKGPYDLVLLGHICHSEGPAGTRRLFRKVAGALKPGGTMAVMEFLPDEDRCGDDGGDFALLFALNMLVGTEDGGTFTVGEYEAWAQEAGFGPAELIEVGGSSPVMLFSR